MMTDRATGSRTNRTARLIETLLPWLILAVAVGVFVWHSVSNAFLQDDSFITYRYARNIIRGIGPVFNPGERVEGYTNFLWLMLLSALGVLGLPFTVIIPLSQVIGVAAGIGTIVISFLLLRRLSIGPPLLRPLPLLLLAANGSFAYWAVSGMESSLFALLIAGATLAYFSSTERRLIVCSGLLGLAAITRPEGLLFAAIFILHTAVTTLRHSNPDRRWHQIVVNLLALLLPLIVIVAPLYIWRLSYYGWLFPNTFYAKTGTSVSYIKTGLDYLWGWLRAYGLFGILPLVTAILALRSRPGRPVVSFALLVLGVFSAYVVAVGGDVLRIYRFFVPVYFLFYLIISEGLWALPVPRAVSALILLALVPYTYIGPFAPARSMHAEVKRNLVLEKGLVEKMSLTGRWLNRQLGPEDWFACPTIGAVSFYSDRRLIDLLGLTDAVIAHHPENILGPRIYWKERNYNTRHVLERNPRYIYFSTGIKPSAAAERALFLRTRFRVGYFPCPISMIEGGQIFSEIIYKAKPGSDTLPIETPGVNPDFIDLYNLAINSLRLGPDTAYTLFRRCHEIAPADFAYPLEWMGDIALRSKREEEGRQLLEQAVAIDDWCINAHISLANFYYNRGDIERALLHASRVVAYAPDYHEGYNNLFAVLVQAGRPDSAEKVILEAINRFPAIDDMKLRLAYARMLAGRLDEAESDLRGYLARNPNHREAQAILQQLRERRARP